MKHSKNTATALQTRADQSNSKFFSLPPEIRNEIYELVLEGEAVVFDPPTKASGKGRNRKKASRGGAKCPGILMSCKQAYEEGIQLFYSCTATFYLHGHAQLFAWLRKLGNEKVALVKKVTVEEDFLREYCQYGLAFYGGDMENVACEVLPSIRPKPLFIKTLLSITAL